MQNVYPNQENASQADIEEALRCAGTRRFHLRLLTVRSLFIGQDIESAARLFNVTPRTVYNWIKRWNKGGIDALADLPKSGRKPKADCEQRSKIVERLEHPELEDQTHWTAIKLWGRLTKAGEIDMGYSTFARLLHNEGYCLKVPRPWPVEQDEELRNTFRADLSELLRKGNREVWFCDVSGFLADPRPRQIWAKKGSKPTTPKTGAHIRESVIAAVCPSSGLLSSLVFNRVDSQVFQVFPDNLAQDTGNRKIVLVLDNASWHKVKSLNWHQIEPLYLPPYSPDLNPIERLWAQMKAGFFTQWYTDNRETLIDRICEAILSFMERPNAVRSICAV